MSREHALNMNLDSLKKLVEAHMRSKYGEDRFLDAIEFYRADGTMIDMSECKDVWVFMSVKKPRLSPDQYNFDVWSEERAKSDVRVFLKDEGSQESLKAFPNIAVALRLIVGEDDV